MMTEEEEKMLFSIININKLFSETMSYNTEGKNKIVSPLIMHKFLLMISHDKTYIYRGHFNSALYIYGDHDRYIKYYKDTILSFCSFNNKTLSLGNKLFIINNNILQDDFKNIVNDFLYETECYNDEKMLTKHIDSWVEKQTNGLIKGLANNSLTDTTCLALINIIYYKGKWDGAFHLEPDRRTFYLKNGNTIEIQMIKMTGEVYCNFTEDVPFTAIELPFTSDEISLFLLLPNKRPDIDTSNLWLHLPESTSDMTKKLVEISLPKFKIEEFLNCRNLLLTTSLREEFRDDVCFFDMLLSDEFVKFSQINEMGSITVDEEVVEAASGLAVTIVPAEPEKMTSPDGIKMTETTIKTTISNHFAKTLVMYKIQNNNACAVKRAFIVILPEAAFATELVMETNGKSYKSYITGIEETKAIYKEALTGGEKLGIINFDKSHLSQLNISVNLEPQSVTEIFLTYEEVLQRVHDQYELILNISPGRIVDNLNVEVNINESGPLKFVRTPPLRSKEEVNPKIKPYIVPSSDIKVINSNSSVRFSVDVKQQRKISSYLGTPLSMGLACQFVVQYDVERDPKSGEVLLQDGYFFHSFAPSGLDPLPKHVIFVLDTSSISYESTIGQLKDVMMSILNVTKKGDLISIVEFNKNVIVWDIESEESKTISWETFNVWEEPFRKLSELSLPKPVLVDDIIINKVKNIVQKMAYNESAHIIAGLGVALYMIKVEQDKIIDENSKYQPILVLLTRGQPSRDCGSSAQIIQTVTQLNMKHNNVPIFSLSFGQGTDKSFLKQLSQRNFGFTRHIYDVSDVSLQSFYKKMFSPVLRDIEFRYDSNVTEVTTSHFPVCFKGEELLVAGRCRGHQLSSTITGCGLRDNLNLGSVTKNPVSSLERLWAFLTVRTLLKERDSVHDQELTKKVVDLALKYSLFTDVTCLIIVKSNENPDVCVGPDYKNILVEAFGKKSRGLMRKPRRQKCCAKTFIDKITEETVVVEEIEPEKTKKLKFVADHPFLIAIALKKGDKRIFIFMGRVHEPSH